MSCDKEHIKHVMLHKFRKGITASQANKNINAVYSNRLSRRTCYRWFKKFQKGDFGLETAVQARSIIID